MFVTLGALSRNGELVVLMRLNRVNFKMTLCASDWKSLRVMNAFAVVFYSLRVAAGAVDLCEG